MGKEEIAIKNIKDHAKLMVGLYSHCYPKLTKGFFWRVRLQTKIAMDWESSNAGLPKELKEQLGEEIANEIFKDTTAEIIMNKKLFEEAIKYYNKWESSLWV